MLNQIKECIQNAEMCRVLSKNQYFNSVHNVCPAARERSQLEYDKFISAIRMWNGKVVAKCDDYMSNEELYHFLNSQFLKFKQK